METITVPKGKLGEILTDVERLVTHVETLLVDQDKIAKRRRSDIDSGSITGKSEAELDKYLKTRGIKIG